MEELDQIAHKTFGIAHDTPPQPGVGAVIAAIPELQRQARHA
jgi:hypothetical protein